MAYYVIFPLAWRFFLSFETPGRATATLPIELEARVAEYLSLVMKLIFAFGLSFQLPVALTLMGRVGLITSEQLAPNRKYAIVAVFVVAAVLTPPDMISQIGWRSRSSCFTNCQSSPCAWWNGGGAGGGCRRGGRRTAADRTRRERLKRLKQPAMR